MKSWQMRNDVTNRIFHPYWKPISRSFHAFVIRKATKIPIETLYVDVKPSFIPFFSGYVM